MSQVRRSLSSLALPLLGAWVLGVACYEEPLLPVFGYETDDIACSDHQDNDADCLVDCEDPDCLELSTLCGELIPEGDFDEFEDPRFGCAEIDAPGGGTQRDCSENLSLCRDFIDNDLNGQFDCGDRQCQDVFETGCLREATNELCSDNIDNDENGFADCDDFGCTRSPLVDVCVEGEGDSGGGSCANGRDDDGDGAPDCDDPDCATTVACGQPEATFEACSNGSDDDLDGYADCDDYDCSRSEDPETEALCAPEEQTYFNCSDGRDNDGDELVDCDDRDCGQNPDPMIRDHCNGLETSARQCSDGIDNDGNGFLDCGDFSCSMSTDPEVLFIFEANVE